MKARVQVYAADGVTYNGILPVIGLTFSEEVGGAGSCTFEALEADLNATDAWDSVLKIGLEVAPNTWMLGPAYVIRKDYTTKKTSLRYSITCKALLEAWASETLVMPEYITTTMPTHAGLERGVGWMARAYDASGDPYEPWDKNEVVTTRTTRPKDWPTGSGALWITASGSTNKTEGKYFRTWFTVPGTGPRVVQFWLSADESADLWVAGEKIISTSSVEDGYKECKTAKMVMYPDVYVMAIYTATAVAKGDSGDGYDPVIAAAGIIDSTGNVVANGWIGKTNAAWLACRRDTDPPNNIPPGPTPGAMLLSLTAEARERSVSGWPKVTQSYTASTDSYGKPWGTLDVLERVFKYGHDSYWDAFQAFSESDEVDIWMTADLVLHAAPRQGQHKGIILTTKHLNTFSITSTEGNGTWVMARSRSGWVQHSVTGSPRREYGVEVGEAITSAVASKVAKASLRDAWRYDASGSLNPPQAGWIPYVDIKLGDDLLVPYAETDPLEMLLKKFSITSFSAKAGEGGLLWDVELTEFPPPAVPSTFQVVLGGSDEPGVFDNLEELEDEES